MDEFIRVLYLPPNITALCQPMDQGVIETFRRLYRKELLRKLLLTDEDEESVIKMYKKIFLKDACYMISSSWSELKNVTLERAWLKLFPPKHNQTANHLSPMKQVLKKSCIWWKQYRGFQTVRKKLLNGLVVMQLLLDTIEDDKIVSSVLTETCTSNIDDESAADDLIRIFQLIPNHSPV
jgi:hypothetical protein